VRRIFLLSPAHCGGLRARMVLSPRAGFELARRVQAEGAPLGEIFAFLSGLYFRGKLAYARAFAPAGGAFVITPIEGLRPLDDRVGLERLRAYAEVDIHEADARYRGPLLRDARAVAAALDDDGEAVLLGSVATAKYVEPLLEVFGPRLVFPSDFVGRGDMSRGGLLLRCADAGKELPYVPVATARRRGPRPPRLVPRRRLAR
jgi:hypothetical protein